jgi:hypothetical protein
MGVTNIKSHCYSISFLKHKANKYEMAERVVVGRIQAYKDSIVTSDVWLPHFKVNHETPNNQFFYST